MKLFFGIATVSVAGVLAGCGHTGALREEASVDLNCPESRIRIVGHGRDKEAIGCDQRAYYHWTGRTWVREGQPAPQGVYVQNGGPPPVNQAQPAPNGPQPIRVQPQPQPAAQPTGTPSMPPPGPQAPLPPAKPPGQSL